MFNNEWLTVQCHFGSRTVTTSLFCFSAGARQLADGIVELKSGGAVLEMSISLESTATDLVPRF